MNWMHLIWLIHQINMIYILVVFDHKLDQFIIDFIGISNPDLNHPYIIVTF